MNALIAKAPEFFEVRERAVKLLDSMLVKEVKKSEGSEITSGSMLVMRTASEREIRLKQEIAEHRKALATHYQDIGEREKALLHYEKVLEILPSSQEARQAVIALRLERGETEKGIEQLGLLANSCREKGLLRDVLQIYERALQIDKENTSLMNELAKLYAEQGFADKAVRLFRRSADLQWASEQFELAVQTLDLALAVEPNNVTLLAKLARAYAKMGKSERAREGYTRLTDAYCERGLFARAEQILERDMEEFPEDTTTWCALARMWEKRKHSELGIALLEKLLAKTDSPEARTLLERFQKSLQPEGRKQAGRMSLGAVRGGFAGDRYEDEYEGPKGPTVHAPKDAFGEAKTNFERGRYSTAVSQFQKLSDSREVERSPDEEIEIQNFMGLCHFHMEEFVRATECFVKAREIPDGDVDLVKEVSYNLAMTHEKAGQMQEAVEIWKEIYSMDPSFRDVKTKILSIHLKKRSSRSE